MLTLTLKAIIVTAMALATGYTNGLSKPTRSLGTELGPFVQKYDIKKIRTEIDSTRKSRSFPQFAARARGDYPGMAVSLRLLALNQALFGGREIISAVAVESDQSTLHQASRVIGIPKKIIPALEKNPLLLNFTLAHALAHYIFELNISKSADHKSPYGNVSRDDGAVSESPASARSHAEIDALALSILELGGEDAYGGAAAAAIDFRKTKFQNDSVVGWLVIDVTPIRMIPDDLISRVQDNYVRAYSLIRTMSAFHPRNGG